MYDILDDGCIPWVIDYLSLDVEGIEVSILEEFFNSPNRDIRLMTVEYREEVEMLMRLRRMLEPRGYVFDCVRAWDAFFRK